jgi:transposase
VKGRKLHALVDVEGLPLRVVVHSAGMQDRDGAGVVLDKIRQRFPWLELVWADSGYNACQVKDAVAKVPGLRIEIVKRSDDRKSFVVLPRRWVVERTFSWFGRNRRLAKDYENLADTLATFVTLAAIQLGIRRLARRWLLSQALRDAALRMGAGGRPEHAVVGQRSHDPVEIMGVPRADVPVEHGLALGVAAILQLPRIRRMPLDARRPRG